MTMLKHLSLAGLGLAISSMAVLAPGQTRVPARRPGAYHKRPARRVPATAQNVNWTDADRTHVWSDAGNWDQQIVPDGSSYAATVSNVDPPFVCMMDTSITLDTLTIESEAQV